MKKNSPVRKQETRHRITYHQPPKKWREGFPLGNGVFGAMAWGDGKPLCFTLDHAEIWDLRRTDKALQHPDYNYAGLRRLVGEGRFAEALEVFEEADHRENPTCPMKISLGRLELEIGAPEEWESILDIDSATVSATMRSRGKEIWLSAFVHKEKNVLCLRLTNCSKKVRLKFRPLAEITDYAEPLGYPASESRKSDGLEIIVQQIPEGLAYAVGWNRTGPDFFVAAETAKNVESACGKVRMLLQKAQKDGFARLYREHCSAWRKFWSVSEVRLSEKEAEFFWYYGVYLLASSARRGVTPPGLQGLWAMDGVLPPWRGEYASNLNVQETFWPACASGHLDLLDCWCDFMKKSIPAAQEFTRKFFKTEGTFWMASMLSDYTFTYGWCTVQFAWNSTGWLAWLVWLRWRYSFDLKWLAETGYPVVAEGFKFYRDNLVAEPDGYLHVPLSTSPEYKENKPEAWAKDPNIDLALIRRCCDWVMEMESALNKNDLTPAAKNIRAKLAPYALTPEKELCLWPNKPLDESHRHPGHLMAIHPAMDLTIDGSPEEQEIINASVEHFNMLGPYLWAGHTYAQLVSFAAVLGRAGWAYDNLRKFIDYWVGPNGLYFNVDQRDSGMFHYFNPREKGPFTMESNCGISAGISDMLVQGWGDKIRIFPAIPKHWREAAFRDLLVEGAFRVSAVRQENRTVWVEVTAGVKRQMRLLNPFEGSKVKTSGAKVRREGNLLVADLKAGQSVIFSLDGKRMDLIKAMALVKEKSFSPLGL